MLRRFEVSVAVCLLLGTTACGDDGGATGDGTTEAGTTVSITSDSSGSPGTEDPGTTDTGLETTAADETTGPTPLSPVQVFLLAGQSNMEGYGPRLDQDTGDWPMSRSLEDLIANGEEDAGILDARNDVWVSFLSPDPVLPPGPLEPGFGDLPSFFGPELGLGELLGNEREEPIVLFKVAEGGTTLGIDWRPPSAGGRTGPMYQTMIDGYAEFETAGLSESFPTELEARGYRLAGFLWLQGWNDQFEDGLVPEYQSNLEALVRDVRDAVGDPDLPAVIIEGPTLDEELRQARLDAVATLEAEQPGRTVLVETADLVTIELEGNFHFHFNAANYLEVGRRTAQAILDQGWLDE